MEETNRARMAQEQFQQAQLAQTLGLQREQFIQSTKQNEEMMALRRMLGLLPYAQAPAQPPERGMKEFDPTKELRDIGTGKVIRPGTAAPLKPAEKQQADIEAYTQQLIAGGDKRSPEQIRIDLTKQPLMVQGLPPVTRTEAIRPLPPSPTVPAQLSYRPEPQLGAEEAGAYGLPGGSPKSAASGRTPLTAAQRTKMDAQNASLAIIENIDRQIKEAMKAGTTFPSGPLSRILGTTRAAKGVYLQADPKLVRLHSQVGGTLALLVRSLGEVGTLSEGDIQRARNLMPTFAPVPDTAAVIQEKLDGLRELVQEVASRTGALRTPQPSPSPGWSIRRR